MGVTIQVRNLDPVVQESLKKLAKGEGLSLSEYLRRTLTRIAEGQRVKERWEAAVAQERASLLPPEPNLEGWVDVDDETIVRAVREGREERETGCTV